MNRTASPQIDEAPPVSGAGPDAIRTGADHPDREPAGARPLRVHLSRRGVLGALAAGAAAVACGPGGSPQGTGGPAANGTSSGPTGSPGTIAAPSAESVAPAAGGGGTKPGGLAATATGPELDRVTLPVSSEPGNGMAGAGGQTGAPSAGGGTGAAASPAPPPPSPQSSPPTLPAPAAAPAASTPTSAPAATAPPTTAARATPRSIATPAVLLANRITFGTTPEVLSRIEQLGGGGFIDDQLARTGPDPEVEGRLGQLSLLRLMPSLAAYNAVQTATPTRLRQELTLSNLVRAVASRHQLYEMMCHLWMDHFNVDLFGDGNARHLLAHYQEKVIRAHALGSFRDLLKATAQSPAMLAYLDNDTSNANSKQGINENYGRELLELHTLGIAPDGTQAYTEADVRAAAMAMTGWSTVSDRKAADFSAFVFRDNYHFTGDISLLGGAWTRGTTQGKATGDSLLEFLVTHPSTARHVARKLCRRFVSDIPPASLVESAAAVYLANDTKLAPTLRHILGSPELAASTGHKLRRPFEHLAAVLRALGTPLPADPASEGAKRLQRQLDLTDHMPWSWPQPDGFPDTAAHWLSTGGLVNRWSIGAQLAAGRIPGLEPDLRPLVPAGGTVGDLIGSLATRFGLGPRPAEEIATVAAAVKHTPTDPVSALDAKQLPTIPGLLLAHPIFQTR